MNEREYKNSLSHPPPPPPPPPKKKTQQQPTRVSNSSNRKKNFNNLHPSAVLCVNGPVRIHLRDHEKHSVKRTVGSRAGAKGKAEPLSSIKQSHTTCTSIPSSVSLASATFSLLSSRSAISSEIMKVRWEKNHEGKAVLSRRRRRGERSLRCKVKITLAFS